MMRTKWLWKYTGQMSEVLFSAHTTWKQSRVEGLFQDVLGMMVSRSPKKSPLGGLNLLSVSVCACRCVSMQVCVRVSRSESQRKR